MASTSWRQDCKETDGCQVLSLGCTFISLVCTITMHSSQIRRAMQGQGELEFVRLLEADNAFLAKVFLKSSLGLLKSSLQQTSAQTSEVLLPGVVLWRFIPHSHLRYPA